ncbi:unnamed protein product [Dimorphilus gyrociliatus]|uniref:Sulfotransferase domain-containing protein n=1 Tax=Dimorphilus gyrociliatus TaxID=2664684 RepID=A0A7I8W0X4_9ANNE|nr:unnamed protein product [Dimorphilus gyrociliatus]
MSYRAPDDYVWEDNVIYPGFVPASSLRKIMYNFQMGEGDVLISTFMKSGTTWMQEIVWLIMNFKDIDAAKKIEIYNAIPYIEIDVNGNNYENLPKEPPRLMKTHLPSYFFEKHFNSGAKFIVVVRNPKDLLVSLYSFIQMNKTMGNFDGSFEELFETFIQRKLPYGDPLDFIANWWKFKDHPKILFMHYEEMKRDLQRCVKLVSKFLEIDLNDDLIKEIANNTTFEAMKSNAATNYTMIDSFDCNVSPFMRKGIVGDWRNVLNDDQSSLIDKRCKELYETTNFQFQFE